MQSKKNEIKLILLFLHFVEVKISTKNKTNTIKIHKNLKLIMQKNLTKKNNPITTVDSNKTVSSK